VYESDGGSDVETDGEEDKVEGDADKGYKEYEYAEDEDSP